MDYMDTLLRIEAEVNPTTETDSLWHAEEARRWSGEGGRVTTDNVSMDRGIFIISVSRACTVSCLRPGCLTAMHPYSPALCVMQCHFYADCLKQIYVG